MDNDSGVVTVMVSQLAWVGRFVVALGVLGLAKWWLQEVIGLDIEKNINNLEALLQQAVDNHSVTKAIPITVLFLAGMLLVGYVVGGFVH